MDRHPARPLLPSTAQTAAQAELEIRQHDGSWHLRRPSKMAPGIGATRVATRSGTARVW